MGCKTPRKLKHCGATGKKPVAPQALRLLLLIESVDEQRDDGVTLDDAFERLGQQRRARQLTDLAAGQGRFGQGDRIGHDQFIEWRGRNTVDRRTRQHRVRAIRHDFFRAALFEHFGSLGQGPAVSTMSSMITQLRLRLHR